MLVFRRALGRHIGRCGCAGLCARLVDLDEGLMEDVLDADVAFVRRAKGGKVSLLTVKRVRHAECLE